MPFYIQDHIFAGHIDDIERLCKVKNYKKSFYGLSQIRQFINPFIEEYPILKSYISNQENILYSSRGAHQGNLIKTKLHSTQNSKFYKSLLNCWWYILYKHFYVFSNNNFIWHDSRQEKFYKENKEFGKDVNILNLSQLLDISIKKYDRTCYFNNNIPNLDIISKSDLVEYEYWKNPYHHFNKFYDFIEELNKNGLKYVIIRGYWKLPITPDTDLDIVSHPDTYDKFIEIVKKYWSKNTDVKTPITFYQVILPNVNKIKCEYTKWWTTGKEDINIENKRFTMDTYSNFFFSKNHVLNRKFTDLIFSDGLQDISTERNYYILKPELEIILLGYRNYFEIKPKGLPFKLKHIKIIKNKNSSDFNKMKQIDSSLDEDLYVIKRYICQETKKYRIKSSHSTVQPLFETCITLLRPNLVKCEEHSGCLLFGNGGGGIGSTQT